MTWRLLILVLCCIHGFAGKTINFIVTHEEFFQVEGDEDDTYIRLPEHHEKALDLHLITPGENFTILNAAEYEEQFAKTLRETRDDHVENEADADNANDNEEEFYDEYDNEDDEQNNFDPDFKISDRYEDDFDEFNDDSEADIYAVYDVLDTGKGRYSRGDGVYNELNDYGVVYDNIKGKYSRDYTYDDYGDDDGGIWADVGGDGDMDAFLSGISEDDLIGESGSNSGEKGNFAIADDNEIKSILAKTAYGYSGEKESVDIADVNSMDRLTKPNDDNSGDRGNVATTDVKSNVDHDNNMDSLDNLKAANDNMRRKPSVISNGEDGVRRVMNRDAAAREIKDKVVETLVNINDALNDNKGSMSGQGNGEDNVHKQERIRNTLKLNEFGKTHEKLWNILNSNGVGNKQDRISNDLDSKGIGENQGSIRNGLNPKGIGDTQARMRNGLDSNDIGEKQARIMRNEIGSKDGRMSNGLDSKGIGETQDSIRNGLNANGKGSSNERVKAIRNTLNSKGADRKQQRMRGLEKTKIGEVTADEGNLENVQKLSKSLGQQETRLPRQNMRRPSKAMKPGPRSKTGRRHRRVRRGAEAVWANSLPNTQPAAEKGDEPEEWKVVMDKEMTMSKEEQMADIGRHLGITLGAVAVLALFLICFVRDPKACAIACGTGCPCCVICCPCLRSFTDKYLNVKAIIKSKINEYMPGVIINPDGTLDYYEPTEEETDIMMDIMKDLKGF